MFSCNKISSRIAAWSVKLGNRLNVFVGGVRKMCFTKVSYAGYDYAIIRI